MKNIVTGLLLTLFSSFFYSCNKKTDVSYRPAGSDEIRIGALLALTGSGSSSGQFSSISLDLARTDIQAWFDSSGIEKKLTLITADTRTDTAEALVQLRQLYDKGIRIVIGPYSSAELAALKQFADSHGMLLVSPSSVAVSMAIPGDNLFRFVSSDLLQGKAMAKMVNEDKMKILVPLVRNDVWGRDLLAATSAEFTAGGGVVAQPVFYPVQNADWNSVLSNLNDIVGDLLVLNNPDVVAVYMLSFGEGVSVLTSAKHYQHLNKVYWYGSSAFAENGQAIADTTAAWFAYTHGLPCPIYGLDENAATLWQPLQKRITDRAGKQPDAYAYTAYDALRVAVHAMLIAGEGSTTTQLKNAFIGESNRYFGVTGYTSLDLNGDRSTGNYDFWSVKKDSTGFCWKLTARYHSTDGTLVRYKP
jgi:branched-chain amino acid transport system substrate-binding protein